MAAGWGAEYGDHGAQTGKPGKHPTLGKLGDCTVVTDNLES